MRLSRVFRSRKAIPLAVMAVAASAALPAAASADNPVDITPFQTSHVVVNTVAGANQNTALTQVLTSQLPLGTAVGSSPLQLVAQAPNAADGTQGDFYCLDTGANPLGLGNLIGPND